IDVKPRRPAMMPTTRNSSASCSMSPPSEEVQLRVLYLHALEVVVAAPFVAAEVDIRILVNELVTTEVFHFRAAFGPHAAAVRRRGAWRRRRSAPRRRRLASAGGSLRATCCARRATCCALRALLLRRLFRGALASSLARGGLAR